MPQGIKNLKKAARRILKAVKEKEKIILYGDADLDGTTSVIILKEAIKTLGCQPAFIYFPDREKEGYGISQTSLGFLRKFRPALLISLDCGIGNFKEISLANKMGFEVIVVDHHKALDPLPPAKIIVDPKQKGDRYPFKDLAAAGITFKLAQDLLGGKMSRVLKKNFVELVALATMADMMPKISENKDFIEEGLYHLEDSWRPGIKAFFEADFLKKYSLSEKVFKIISILNVRDVQDRQPASFRLLTTSSLQEAALLIPKLYEKNRERKKKVSQGVELIEKKISGKKEPIIFEGDDVWDFIIISPVASILCKNSGKPTFIFKKLDQESQGTVRVPSGIDSVSLMEKCKKLLITFGGHPQASGFRIKNRNLQSFKKCLIENL